MEQRHPDDTTPRVEDLFAAGIAAMNAEVPDEAAAPPEAAAPRASEAPANYSGPTQATVPDTIVLEGKGPSEAPMVALSAKPSVALADDEDIEW
jgi:hypothetical protein